MTNSQARAAVLIVAGGAGLRMGGTCPKQYLPLLGQSVLDHSIRRFRQLAPAPVIYVAIHPDHRGLCRSEGIRILETAGATRQDTVRQSLERIAADGAAPEKIFVHDAARPCWTLEMAEDLLQAAAPAAAPALAVPDTLRRLSGNVPQTLDRSDVHLVQTPQLFSFDALLDLHRRHAATAVTDDAGLFELAGQAVRYVPGHRDNIKITQDSDVSTAAAILSARCGDVRSASGYDVHAFVPATPGRPLRLGGITIAHDKTLSGHSDADALLHAITDALLGCIAAEDIGHHFSPKDARWKDADSTMFLAHARDLITVGGGIISHIDATVICEEPKIGPHRAAMQSAIAAILHIDAARVSIKATTSEGLGFTGRGEGLAAQATATVRLPFDFCYPSSCQKGLSHAA